MTSQTNSPLPQPPQVATWLLTLFTPPELTELIIGDLLEEFSSLAARSTVPLARRWYWRQVLKTSLHAGGSAFRAAPLLLLVLVIGGFWLTGFITRFSADAMHSFLAKHRIYESNPDAYLFWTTFPLEMGRVFVCGVVGSLMALLAKGKEMVAVLALVLLQVALFLAGAIWLIASGRQWFDWFLLMLLWNGLGYIASVMGGTIVRSRRKLQRGDFLRL